MPQASRREQEVGRGEQLLPHVNDYLYQAQARHGNREAALLPAGRPEYDLARRRLRQQEGEN